MVLCVNFNTLILEEELYFRWNGGVITLRIRGLIYHSQMAGHFTSVVIDGEGIMWYHDGMITGRTCVRNGRFSEIGNLLTLHRRSEEHLCAVIYALK